MMERFPREPAQPELELSPERIHRSLEEGGQKLLEELTHELRTVHHEFTVAAGFETSEQPSEELRKELPQESEQQEVTPELQMWITRTVISQRINELEEQMAHSPEEVAEVASKFRNQIQSTVPSKQSSAMAA